MCVSCCARVATSLARASPDARRGLKCSSRNELPLSSRPILSDADRYDGERLEAFKGERLPADTLITRAIHHPFCHSMDAQYSDFYSCVLL